MIFVDEIMILASEGEHKEHLRISLPLLRDNNMYANYSKCEFWLPNVKFSSCMENSLLDKLRQGRS